MNNPYQTPIMNNYLPQYGAYQYNPMANMQRFQSQEQIQSQIQQPVPQQIAGINGRIVANNVVSDIDNPYPTAQIVCRTILNHLSKRRMQIRIRLKSSKNSKEI